MRVLTAILVLIPSFALAQSGVVERKVDPARHVVILVNESSAESMAVGRHYAERRGVPEGNICRVKTTDKETISWPDYREQIEKPLARFVGRFPEALYVVPVYGIPSRISEEDPENDAPKDEPDNTLTKFVTNRDYACVDAELALIPRNGHEVEGWFDSELFGKDEPVTPAHRMFLVSRLDGPSAAIASALVDKALYAETYGPAGESYLDTRGLDPKTPLGATDEEMRETKNVFAKYGIALHHEDTAAVQDLSTFKDCLHYWGWYAPDISCSQPFTFRPGAVAAHLHSSSALSIRDDRKYWVGPLLAHGATCTAGTVYEPLVTGFPSMHIVLDRLFKGYTWGEACAMGNRKLSWMAVFVGDPLYAPYAKGMKESQGRNVALAADGYSRAAAALDAGDLDAARKVLDEIRSIAVPLEGGRDLSFLAREIASRGTGKTSGTIDELVKRLAEARAARDKGEDKAAQTALEKALSLSPNSFDANLALGTLFVQTERAQQALAPLEKARKVFPADPALFEPFGRALAANGKFAEAIPLLQDALEAGAGSDCMATLGDCYLKTKQAAKAILFLADATKKDAKNRAAFVALGRAYEENKDIPSALKTLKEAVRIYPETVEDITPYKNAWKALQLTAGHSTEKREKEDVEWVVRDFDNQEYQPPTKGVALDIAKQADTAAAAEGAVSMGSVPAEIMKVPGLPRLVMGNASGSSVTVFMKGSTPRLLKYAPTGAALATQEIGVWPGEYEIVVVVVKGTDKTVLTGRVTFELNRRYGMVLDSSLAMMFPPK
ncbi:MAG: TIGR03790 family protein [Planctomycetes bacterium]|nr:TIGR03790 family protein [Planctomycetota bacterium]